MSRTLRGVRHVICAISMLMAGAACTSSTPPSTATVDAPGAAAQAAAVPSGFVYRQGRNLMLDGQPYRFAGFNGYTALGCGTGTPWSDAQFDTLFGQLPPQAMTRTFAFESRGIGEIDRIVTKAEEHDQKLILALGNAGEDCDGFRKDANWYRSGYRDGYLDWVRTVVSRYAGSPAIGMWEIMNEPGHLSDVDVATMKSFFDDVAATIKSLDPHHLVGTGTQAEYTPGTTDFQLVHSGPNIDVASLHEYDYDPGNGTLLNTYLSRHLGPTLTAAYRLNKPLIVGETGIEAGRNCPVTLEQRASVMRQKIDTYMLSGVAGVLLWSYTPNPGDGSCELRFREAQPDGTPADPAIATVVNYRPPTPVPAPATSGTPVVLVARHSNRCVDVTSASTANGTPVQQWACGFPLSQRFRIEPTSDGFYRIVSVNSGKCVDVTGLSMSDGAALQQWDCWGGPNQQFRFMPAGGGYYWLITRHTQKCLRLPPDDTGNGARVTQHTCFNGPAQQFRVQT